MFYILDFILPGELKNFNRNEAQGFIKALLEKIVSSENAKGYDYILFDCPPSFSLLSESALSCCDLVLIPFNPDFYATHGITILLHILQTLKEKVSFTIPPKMALFMNKAKAVKGNLTKESQEYLNQARGICSRMGKKMNIRCFDSPIYDRVDIKRAAVMETGKSGIPSDFVPDFQKLWDNITGFIDEQ
jgi:chromosome partitioning protein